MKSNSTGTPIKINGSNNIDLGEGLPRKVQEELLRLTEAYFRQLNHATVGFTRDGHWYGCTINVQVGNLKVIVAEASAADCHRAFDQALVKVGRRLNRRNRRLADATMHEAQVAALA